MIEKRRLNVLIVITNLGRGGAQKVFRQQLSGLTDKFNVVGCVFNWEGAFADDHQENILSLDVPGGTSLIRKSVNFLKRIKRLKKIKTEKKIDVTISHLEGADYVNLLSRVNDKTICWIHGTKKYDENINGFLGWIRRRVLMPWLYRKSDRIVAVSKGITDELSKDIPELKLKLSTIYNGFDVDLINKLSLENLEPELIDLFHHSAVLITHCRLSRQKNLTALIDLFSEVRKSIPARLIIIGDGELREELVLFAKSYDIKVWSYWDQIPLDDVSDLYFIGHHANPFRLLKRAKLYIMTSGWEGFPLAICEAMACGLPVAVTDCYTGPREIIAPDIRLAQPVQQPYLTRYGFLMPLLNFSDLNTMGKWIEVIQNMLTSNKIEFRRDFAIARVREFDSSKSNMETVKLILEINS